MFKEFYGLHSDPFRLSPDHNFCYRYPSFAKGRAYMQYALQAAEGFVVVTGSPGMGKTTLINDLLADYGPRDYTVATLVNTMLEANEVLRSAAYEFGLNVENMDTATVLQRLKQLFAQSHADGRPPLLVVDEAQNLTLNALEELRMLTNVQANGKPLLQIFLVGQEELREKLQDPSLEQLRQRVTAAAHLHALDQNQVAAYIVHRLKVVGWEGFPKLKSSLLPVIDAACEGVPRRINQFCSRLLLHGAVEQKSVLDAEDARLVFAELAEERLSRMPAQVHAENTTEFLGGEELGGEVSKSDEEIREDPKEVESQQKVVMPPPKLEEVRIPPPPEMSPVETPLYREPPRQPKRRPPAEPIVPGMDETYAGYPGPGGRPRRGPPPPDPMDTGLRHPNLYPRRRRSSRSPWFGMLVFLALLAGLGAYAWYQVDRESAEDLLGLEIDSYLSELSGDGKRDIVPIQRQRDTEPTLPDDQGPVPLQPVDR